MKTTKFSMKKKVLASSSMLVVSAMMLSTATYAWFTMNKEVSVTGMELKAHSEEGLLINEVKLATSNTWDDQAQGAATPITFELRPTSTKDLANWWHANSKKSADEAGIDSLVDTVDVDTSGNKYVSLSDIATDQVIIGAEGATSGEKATGNTQAETHVWYSDASYGTAGSYQNGEGYYVNYKYYLKSSGSADLEVSDLKVAVTAALKDDTASVQDIDKSLRVGVKIDSNFLIFAPVSGADSSYTVTNNAAGSESTTVTPKTAEATINATDTKITIPNVNTDGKLVDVYVWFEGEDTNCMSDNLTAVLNAYKIDIKFTDADL